MFLRTIFLDLYVQTICNAYIIILIFISEQTILRGHNPRIEVLNM